MKCFNCGSAMDVIPRHGVEIDHCYSCGAYWLDGGHLMTIVAKEGLDAARLSTKPPSHPSDTCRWCGRTYAHTDTVCEDCDRPLRYNCPRGHGEMMIIEEQGLELDRCDECAGLWFDGRELHEFLDHLRQKP